MKRNQFSKIFTGDELINEFRIRSVSYSTPWERVEKPYPIVATGSDTIEYVTHRKVYCVDGMMHEEFKTVISFR